MLKVMENVIKSLKEEEDLEVKIDVLVYVVEGIDANFCPSATLKKVAQLKKRLKRRLLKIQDVIGKNPVPGFRRLLQLTEEN